MPGAAFASPGEPFPIVIAPPRSTLTAADRIGARRTGMLCGPAGSLRWGDASFDPPAIAMMVADAMRARGADALTSEDAADLPATTVSRRRMTLIVTDAAIDACVPQHGLTRLVGGRRKLKVRGRLTVHWRIADPSGRAPLVEGAVTQTIDEPDASSVPAVVAVAITAAGLGVTTEISPAQ